MIVRVAFHNLGVLYDLEPFSINEATRRFPHVLLESPEFGDKVWEVQQEAFQKLARWLTEGGQIVVAFDLETMTAEVSVQPPLT